MTLRPSGQRRDAASCEPGGPGPPSLSLLPFFLSRLVLLPCTLPYPGPAGLVSATLERNLWSPRFLSSLRTALGFREWRKPFNTCLFNPRMLLGREPMRRGKGRGLRGSGCNAKVGVSGLPVPRGVRSLEQGWEAPQRWFFRSPVNLLSTIIVGLSLAKSRGAAVLD